MNLLNLRILYPDEASGKTKWNELRDSQRSKCSEWQLEWLLIASFIYKNELLTALKRS